MDRISIVFGPTLPISAAMSYTSTRLRFLLAAAAAMSLLAARPLRGRGHAPAPASIPTVGLAQLGGGVILKLVLRLLLWQQRWRDQGL